MSDKFNQNNPSPKYIELLEQYKYMHKYGDKILGTKPKDMFPGYSLRNHIDHIRELCEALQIKTILDYGSGKGHQYFLDVTHNKETMSLQNYWGVEKITLYDPNYPPYSKLPNEKSDGVICVDVLEHIPKDDLDWVLEHIFKYANKCVFLNVDCCLAVKTLPNGENAHCTVEEPRWWKEKVAKLLKKYPHIYCVLVSIFIDKKDNIRLKKVFSNIKINKK